MQDLSNMAGNVGTVSPSQTVNHCGADSLLLDPNFEIVRPSDMSVTVNNTDAPAGAVDGPCTSGTTADVGLLPASCVVEDDELLPGHRRHHHYHHRHHRRRHHRFCRVNWREVNFMAAMLNIVAAVLVCTSLAEPRWWYIGTSPCVNYDQPARYLGVKQFFYKGFFVDRSSYSTEQQTSKYYYGTLQTEGGYFLNIGILTVGIV